jgi:hypothetical protein
MAVLLLLLPFGALVSALLGVWSLRARMRAHDDGIRPSLSQRRLITLAVTVVAVGAHLWAWVQLRPVVPKETNAGHVILGGPGDGLWALMFVAIPWLCMQPINVGLACYSARSVKQAAIIGCALLAIWIAAGASGGVLTRCPAGYTCGGG